MRLRRQHPEPRSPWQYCGCSLGAACGRYFSHMKMDSITVNSKHHRETQWQSPHLSWRGELSSPGWGSPCPATCVGATTSPRPPSVSFAFCLKTESVAPTQALLVNCARVRLPGLGTRTAEALCCGPALGRVWRRPHSLHQEGWLGPPNRKQGDQKHPQH